MAFWGRKRWLKEGQKVDEHKPVIPWHEGSVEDAGYRLSVGKEYFVNEDGSSKVVKLADQDTFVVSPGQFAFILTKERVNIPKGAIGFISIRASIKFKGLMNVSGFQVNPGFNGNLVFAVFNAGPRHINLREGDEIFSLWIADLDETLEKTQDDSGKIPNFLSNIPMDVVNGIAGDSLTAYQLDSRIQKLEADLESRIKKVEKDHNSLKLLVNRILIPAGIFVTLSVLAVRTGLVEIPWVSNDPDVTPSIEQPLDDRASQPSTIKEVTE